MHFLCNVVIGIGDGITNLTDYTAFFSSFFVCFFLGFMAFFFDWKRKERVWNDRERGDGLVPLSLAASIPWPIRLPTERLSFFAASLFASYEAPLVTSNQERRSIIYLKNYQANISIPLTFSETAWPACLMFSIIASKRSSSNNRKKFDDSSFVRMRSLMPLLHYL